MARSSALRTVRRNPVRLVPGSEAHADGSPRSLSTLDGGRVTLLGEDTLEFRDAEARLLVRYRDGALEIAPPTGDLRLSAPAGQVRIDAALDVSVSAGRELSLSGAARVRVEASEAAGSALPSRLELGPASAVLSGRSVEFRAHRLRSVVNALETVASTVRTSATRVELHARDLETTVERISTRAKEAVEEFADLWETRAGRVRALVRGTYRLETSSTALTSEDDTSIDGRRVLLG